MPQRAGVMPQEISIPALLLRLLVVGGRPVGGPTFLRAGRGDRAVVARLAGGGDRLPAGGGRLAGLSLRDRSVGIGDLLRLGVVGHGDRPTRTAAAELLVGSPRREAWASPRHPGLAFWGDLFRAGQPRQARPWMKIPLWTRKLRSMLPLTTASRPVQPDFSTNSSMAASMAFRRLPEMAS